MPKKQRDSRKSGMLLGMGFCFGSPYPAMLGHDRHRSHVGKREQAQGEEPSKEHNGVREPRPFWHRLPVFTSGYRPHPEPL